MKAYHAVWIRPWVNQGYEEAETMRKENVWSRDNEEGRRKGIKEDSCSPGEGT